MAANLGFRYDLIQNFRRWERNGLMIGRRLDHSGFRPWRVVERREVFEVPGKISVAVERVALPDGRLVDDYWQIKLADFGVLFAETEAGMIVCLRQYRRGPRRESLELVAGRIEGEDAPLATARRELLEESGYVSEHWESLARSLCRRRRATPRPSYFAPARRSSGKSRAPATSKTPSSNADPRGACRRRAPRRGHHRLAPSRPRYRNAAGVTAACREPVLRWQLNA
jgi:hypothetical protein